MRNLKFYALNGFLLTTFYIMLFQQIRVDGKMTDYPDFSLEQIQVFLGINNSPTSRKSYYKENNFYAKNIQ